MCASIRADYQLEIRDIARGSAAMIVSARGSRKVRSGRLEIGPLALRDLMDVNRVRSGRQALDIEFDPHAGCSIGQRRGSSALSRSILDVHDHRLCRCLGPGIRPAPLRNTPGSTKFACSPSPADSSNPIHCSESKGRLSTRNLYKSCYMSLFSKPGRPVARLVNPARNLSQVGFRADTTCVVLRQPQAT